MSTNSFLNILLIDKEVGWTSNDVVRKLKGMLNRDEVKKIGHAGTLDPFATGLLLIMLNEGTKKFDHLQTLKKEYIAEIEFGKVTDTYDVTGEVVEEYKREIILEKEKLENILQEKFSGKISQLPPKYSALKVAGKRAYDLARQGKEVNLEPRVVEIYKSEILHIEKNVLLLRVVVSSGTYIRSLAHDLGRELGVGAYCKSLRRTKIGEYDVQDARKINQ
jgi:tRNA pseudouridine55 synthase